MEIYMYSYKIGLLDDDLFRIYQYSEKLQLYGFTTKIFDSISEAIIWVETHDLDAFVIDIHMNDTEHLFSTIESHGGWTTGLALFHKLREISPDIKIVALTNSSLPEVVEWFTTDDSVDYFFKEDYSPYNFPSALFQSLENYYCLFDDRSELDERYHKIHENMFTMLNLLESPKYQETLQLLCVSIVDMQRELKIIKSNASSLTTDTLVKINTLECLLNETNNSIKENKKSKISQSVKNLFNATEFIASFCTIGEIIMKLF